MPKAQFSMETLLDSISDPIFVMDSAGNALWANPAGEKMGDAVEGAVGSASIAQMLKAKGSSSSIQYIRDEAYSVFAYPVSVKGGKPVAVALLFHKL